MEAPRGVIVIDKPAGLTSHDVVAQIRRRLGTRRVGHGGTLDPMATGVLVIGVGQATRLLRWVSEGDKWYEARVRLGASTTTDDREGIVMSRAAPESLSAIGEQDIGNVLTGFRGTILQVPSSVSAIKVGGVRSYRRARAGEEFQLAPREIHIRDVTWAVTVRGDDFIDVDIRVCCSSGTYVRALARDVGTKLGVGGHLTVLRRTQVNGFTLADAHAIDDVTNESLMPIDEAVRRLMPTIVVEDSEVARVLHGRPIPWPRGVSGTCGLLAGDGTLLAVAHEESGESSYDCVFA